jgi:DNA mismatch repair protein MSH4
MSGIGVDRIKIILVPTKRTIQYVEQSVNYVIMLKTYVSAIKNIFQALATAQSDLLLTIREVLQYF